MNQKGDYIHHETLGLCRVDGITTLDMSGALKGARYYILIPEKGGETTVYMPADNPKRLTRLAISREEAEELILSMPRIPSLWTGDERSREQRYREALQSIDCRNWIKVIKTLYLRKLERVADGKKMTATDLHYMELAENKLYLELGHALGIDPHDMVKYIMDRLESGME